MICSDPDTPIKNDPTGIGQTRIPACNSDHLKQVEILLLWKRICARALDLTQNRKELLSRLEHRYTYLRVNEKAGL